MLKVRLKLTLCPAYTPHFAPTCQKLTLLSFSQLATFAAPPAAASTAATPPATLSAALSMAAAAAVPSKFKTREREVFGRSHYWQTCLLVLFELCELK